MGKAIKGLPTQNNTMTFNNKTATTPSYITNAINKQFTNTIKYATCSVNIIINSCIGKLYTKPIQLTASQVQEATKHSKITNSTRPDKIDIRYTKHLELLRPSTSHNYTHLLLASTSYHIC